MRKRTYLLWKKSLLLLLILLAVSSLLYVYFRTHVFTIEHYDVHGTSEEYANLLKAQFEDFEEQNILFVLPGNRTVSYHRDRMKEAIMEVLPNTKIMSIYPSGLHTITVSITPHVPAFLLHDKKVLSEEGRMYTEVASVEDLPLLEMASSTTTLSKETITKLQHFMHELNAVLFEVKVLSIDEYGDIRFSTQDRTTSVILAESTDMDKAWSNILSAIDTEPLKTKLLHPSSSEKLEYLDVRFGNKVFYKFTNSGSTGIIPNTTDEHATSTATTTIQ